MNLPRATGLFALALALTGCDRGRDITLPDAPDAELAFVVLYDNAQVAVIGEVVRRQALYSGRYRLEAEDGDLNPRVFFVRSADVEAAAETACAAEPTAVARSACRGQLTPCASDPAACLAFVRADASCEARVTLADSLPVLAFEPDSAGRMVPVAESALAGLRPCGSVIRPDCPVRVPGFVVTEGDELRCTAPATQLACSLRIDLSGCGAPELVGTLGADGGLDASGGACRSEPLASTDHTVAGAVGYAIVCGEHRFVASYMEVLLGEAECPRQGPSTYNTNAPSSGIVSGLLAIQPPGWAPRWLMTGNGFDDCAWFGCSGRGGSCNETCTNNCDTLLAISECVAEPWPVCAGMSKRDNCVDRCRTWCARPEAMDCYFDVAGLVMTTSPPEAPERDRTRVDLDVRSGRPPSAFNGLVRLGDDARIAVATRTEVRVYLAEQPDRFEQLAVLPVSFEVAGIIGDGSGTELYAYGRAGDPSRAFAAHLRFDATALTLSVVREGPVDAIPSADAAALAGASQEWLVLASTEPPVLSDRPSNLLVPWSIAGTQSPPALPAEGSPTALVALEGGSVLAGVRRTDGRAELLLLSPSADRLDGVRSFELPGGVLVSALAADPEPCAASGANCRVYVGLERTTRPGPALVGAFSWDPVDPSAARLLPSFVETATRELRILSVDASGGRLAAVDAHHNTITPIRLPD